MRVAVLGCGPSGLVAAHAARVAGSDVTIYSHKRKSEIYGAQYLHAPIPGMTDGPGVTVHMQMRGSHAQYRAKVYGYQSELVSSVSTEDLPQYHDAWDIRSTYDNLWDAYAHLVVDRPLGARTPEILDDFDSVISTIPARVLCMDSTHEFVSQPIFALGDAPERGIFVDDLIWSVRQLPKNTIVCDGEGYFPWYRTAKVFNRTTVEWPSSEKAGDLPPGAAAVLKPISTDCTCWPNVHRAGRYGKWEKGVLVHHVYDDVLQLCAGGVHD